MTPDELRQAVDTATSAVSGLPVVVLVDGQERELRTVEIAVDGRLILHADDAQRITR